MKQRHKTLAYLVAALLVVACAASVEAQGRRGGGQGGPGGPGGFGGMGGMFGGNPELTLLRRNDVRKELELLDDQVEQLQGVAEGMNFGEMMGQFRDLPAEERMTKMRTAMEDMQKKAKASVDKILLPHQAARLKQLAIQTQMQGLGGLTSDSIAEQVGISDQQRDQMREKARTLQQEMQKKMQELQAKMRDELLKELTPEQQAKLKELVGEPFQFDPEEPMFGGPGGRGGAGAGGPGAPGGRAPGAAGGAGAGRRGGGRRGN